MKDGPAIKVVGKSDPGADLTKDERERLQQIEDGARIGTRSVIPDHDSLFDDVVAGTTWRVFLKRPKPNHPKAYARKSARHEALKRVAGRDQQLDDGREDRCPMEPRVEQDQLYLNTFYEIETESLIQGAEKLRSLLILAMKKRGADLFLDSRTLRKIAEERAGNSAEAGREYTRLRQEHSRLFRTIAADLLPRVRADKELHGAFKVLSQDPERFRKALLGLANHLKNAAKEK